MNKSLFKNLIDKCWGHYAVNKQWNVYRKSFLAKSSSAKNVTSVERVRRQLVIDTHVIEKGLAHEDYRAGFGGEAVDRLVKNVLLYMNEDQYDEFVVSYAKEVLKAYHIKNGQYGYIDSIPNELISDSVNNYNNKFDAHLDFSKMNFEQFLKNRHSFREYSHAGAIIDNDTLIEIVNLSQTAPSACNRQSVRLYIIDDEERKKAIIDAQRGCIGFGNNVSAFIFVVNDLSLYNSYEMKLPIFDAGIYTLNLLYAAQYYGIYGCILNASFPGVESDVRKIVGVNVNEEINGLIALYKDRSERKFYFAPASYKREAESIINRPGVNSING